MTAQPPDVLLTGRHELDVASIESLRLADFRGARLENFIAELYRYAWPVMLAAIRTGSIAHIQTGVPHLSISADERQLLHDSPHEREELALASIARAEPRFVASLKAGRWDPTKGRSLRSFFIGACAQAFWQEYALWSDQRRRQLKAIANLARSRPASACDEFAADPATQHAQREAVELLLAKARKKSPELEAICLGLLTGMTAVEVAGELGYSGRAVEGRLYQFRKVAWNLVRGGRIDPALVPGSRARITRELARR